ncbi:hypothetical protein BDB01DRAFT_866771 [Pilobolus umbonatus]|nr:hypothetical protein BDB01DRAFT_866771 [Pilobolus umbonatus]
MIFVLLRLYIYEIENILFTCHTKLHLWREEFLDISPLFEDRLEFLPVVSSFFWNMRALLKETVSRVAFLNEDHLREMPKWRYTHCPFPTLSKLVNPLILKVVHEEDSTGVADMGPFYTHTHLIHIYTFQYKIKGNPYVQNSLTKSLV